MLIIGPMQTFYIWGKCILYCHQNLPQQPPGDTSMMNKKEHCKEALRIFKYTVLSQIWMNY